MALCMDPSNKDVVRCSKGAPVPVAGHASRNIRALGQIESWAWWCRHGCGRRGILDIRRGRARGPAVVACVPSLELIETVAACARRCSARVVVGVLIERNLVARVLVAEDVATAAAVVATDEVVESAFAFEVVADGRLGVRLREWS